MPNITSLYGAPGTSGQCNVLGVISDKVRRSIGTLHGPLR